MFDREGILSILANPEGVTGQHANRYLIYRMLQAMFERQTQSEQDSGMTHVLNGVGFNGVDAGFLSDVAVKSRKYKNLTPSQAKAVGRSLKKYVKQLVAIAESKAKPVASVEGEEAA